LLIYCESILPLGSSCVFLSSCRRGYSSEQQRGRWLLQKLDYLQLLLVKRAIGGLTRLGGHVLQQARSINQGKPKSQSTTAQQRKLQRQLSSASSKKQKVLPASKQQQQAAGTASGNASSSRQLRRQNSSSKPRTDGFGRPYPETLSVQQETDTSGRSNGGSSDTDGDTTNSSSSTAAADKESSQEVQHQPQQQLQKQRRGLLAQVSSRAEQSLRHVLLTLSGWGFIPRMDVTPLEQFDEVGCFLCCFCAMDVVCVKMKLR
jgi:hypothetical protein